MTQENITDDLVEVLETQESVAPVEPKAEDKPAVPEQRIGFRQWAAARGKKSHHLPAMMIFCKSHKNPRTASEWDKVFEKY